VRFSVITGVVVEITIFCDIECRGSKFLRNVLCKDLECFRASFWDGCCDEISVLI